MRSPIHPAGVAAALQLLLLLLDTATAANFAYEADVLRTDETLSFPAVAFGDASRPGPSTPAAGGCKVQPEDPDWPSPDEWDRLNATLGGGALLHPEPPAAVCYSNRPELYDRDRCDWLLTNGSDSRFYLDDPLTALTRWPQGDSCPLSVRPAGNCTRGGSPFYVVNATTVRQVQLAVNFARNKNIRLVIKNTGHDFVGKSTGRGAISIWTHNLKSFEFLPTHTSGEYSGMAARVGAGLESWEMYGHMRRNNIHLAVPGDSTVGAYGGWLQGGGHHSLASYFGLGADQPLSLQVVTADGRFVTADHATNPDLFFALRGGGPGTFGVVTSAVVKAYPPLAVSQSPLRFSTSLIGNRSDANEVFWAGVSATYWFCKHATDAGGTVYDYVSPSGAGFTFTADFEMPTFGAAQLQAWVRPLYEALNALGIPAVNPPARPSPRSDDASQGKGDVPGDPRFTTRLFPRRNWEDESLFDATMEAIRASVEAGYTFHGIHMTPTPAVAGWPGRDAAVNPAFRTTQMHADLFDRAARGPGTTPARWLETWAEMNSYMQAIRDVTPGGGAYVNEADRLEPDWQRSFYGHHYPRLLSIKKARDPWGLFYAATTPGSEDWEVRTADGLPTQNGPLCRVAS